MFEQFYRKRINQLTYKISYNYKFYYKTHKKIITRLLTKDDETINFIFQQDTTFNQNV